MDACMTNVTELANDQIPAIVSREMPDPPPAEVKNSRQEILKKIVVESRPAVLPQAWRFLPHSRNVRTVQGRPDELAAVLAGSFPMEQLVAAGVFVRGLGDEARLSNVFGDETTLFEILRDDNRKPHDVLSARGSLSPGVPQILRFASARCAEGAPQLQQQVIVAPSDQDYFVWRQLKWRCVSAAGIGRLRAEQVREIFESDSSGNAICKYVFICPAFQIANFTNQPSAQICEAFAHLWRVNQVLNCDPDKLFRVWRPTGDDFAHIESATTFADRHIVSSALVESLESSTCSVIDYWNKQLTTAKADLPTARGELIRAIMRSSKSPLRAELVEALHRYHRSLGELTVDRCIQAAQHASDPIESGSWLATAKILVHFQETDELAVAAQSAIAGTIPPNVGILDEQQLAEQFTLVNFLMRTRRELGRGK